MTKQFSNYSDLLTFTRASKGHALRPVSYGSELVTNGTFNSDLSDWTDDLSKWSVSGSRAYHAPNSTFAVLRQSVPLTVGKIYRITFDYEVVQGQLRCQARDSSNQPNGDTLAIHDLTGTGSASVIFVPDSDYDSIGFARDDVGVTSEMYVDNISVKEVLFDQTDGTLTLFEHPNNVPRVEWDAQRNRLGLLVEESRTNLFTYSEDFSNSAWTKQNITAETSSAVTSPDREESAYLLTTNAASVSYIELGASVSSSTNYAISAFVKEGTHSVCWLYVQSGASYGTAYFDISDQSTQAVAGSSTTPSDLKIQDVGNGWYRVSAVFDITTGGTSGKGIGVCDAKGSLTASAGKTMYLYGAQLEAGSFPTSYIKNEGTSGGVTRSADVASIPVSDFGYNYTNTVGTFLLDWNTFDDGAGRVFVATSSASASGNRAVDINFNVSTSRTDVYSNHTVGDLYDIGTPLTVGNKVAAAMKENDSAAVLNGGTVDTDTATGTPITATHFHFGNYNSNYLNGHIKKLMYIPRRVTNAQLISLTE